MEQFFYTETMTVMNADADFRSLLKPAPCCAMWSRFRQTTPAPLVWMTSSSKNAV